MAEQRRRGAKEVLDDLAEIERRLEDGSIPPALRDGAVAARHEMVMALNKLLPPRDDGLGGMTTNPDMRVGLPLGTANSPWDDHDPVQMAAYIETKFGPDASKGFRQTMQEAAAFVAANRPEDFTAMPVAEARKLFGIEEPEWDKPKAAAAAPKAAAPAPSAAAAAEAAARAAAAGAPKPK